MIYNLKMFTKANDLEELTGLSHNELWEHGFNLDDMDVGFMSDVRLHDNDSDEWLYCGSDYGCQWLLTQMDSYCAGTCYTEYDGKHYYTVHYA